jgi:glyoxylase I family protein
VSQLHHTAIVTRDLEASLAFWRDGLGLDVLMDHDFEGPWPALFGAATTTLHSVFLGDKERPDSGIVELVVTDGSATRPPAQVTPTEGFFLVSLYADLDRVLPELATLGLGGEPRLESVGPVRLAVVVDPNGVWVELMDDVARRNMGTLAGGAQ